TMAKKTSELSRAYDYHLPSHGQHGLIPQHPGLQWITVGIQHRIACYELTEPTFRPPFHEPGGFRCNPRHLFSGRRGRQLPSDLSIRGSNPRFQLPKTIT